MYKEEGTITTPRFQKEDKNFENILRPLKMKDFVGQEKVKEKLDIFTSQFMVG